MGSSLHAERHVIAFCVPESYGTEGPDPLFDAVRELSWPTLEDLRRARDSAARARLVVTADVAEEYRVIWPKV
ncbi:hypothetical protein ACL02T_33185 [Pseudonocardia sp. RS010]|uniref:hypothetical protein n=1 Tax=Pseudonocardia sp. RS010 TaxID=3385979 RepID=UPI00399FB0DB